MKTISLPLLTLRANAEPPLSSVNTATLYFDSNTGKIMASLGGSIYYVFGDGSGGSSGGELGPNSVGTLELKTNSVTDAKIRQSAGLSLLGRSENSTGNISDIIATTDGDVLRRAGGSIGFGLITQSSVIDLTSDLAAKAIGTGSSTDNAIVRFDGSSGKNIQNSIVTISDSGQIIGIADPTDLSHAANKSYVDVAIGALIPSLDGDKGELTVSGSGLIWTIDANAVSLNKLQTIATDSLLGRDSAGTGNVENITLDSTLVMNGTGVLRRAAITGDVSISIGSNTSSISDSSVGNSKLRNSAGLSVMGRSANSTGVVSDITATAASGEVLRENGSGVIGFGMISQSSVTGLVSALETIDNYSRPGIETLTSDTIIIDTSTQRTKLRAALGSVDISLGTIIADNDCTLVIENDTVGAISVTFSTIGVHWYTDLPSSLPAGKRGILTILPTTTLASGIQAAWAVEL